MKFSIIIPVYNEAKAIKMLLDSINQISGDFEVIAVNDASTDNTAEVLDKESIKVITNSKNEGRYAARIKGAKAASFENLVFVDSRCLVKPDFLEKLETKLVQLNKTPVIIGHSLAQENENSFEIMYRAIREKLFSNFYKVMNEDLWLTKSTFDNFPKGSTVFYTPKDVMFILDNEHGSEFGRDSSDDTKMFKYFMNYNSLVLSPNLSVINYAREGFRESLDHLFKRGAKFVDYYLDPAKKNFWLVIFAPLVFFGIVVINLINFPGYTLISLLILWLCGVLYLGSWKDKLVIFYMLPLIVITFYSGIIRGIILKIVK